tara:strand:+ start:424 stop:675 length:252 start_codon:yes stop_codon:yes gene_type:complete
MIIKTKSLREVNMETNKNNIDKITNEEFNTYAKDRGSVAKYIVDCNDRLGEVEWLLSYLPREEFYGSYKSVLEFKNGEDNDIQ